MYTYIQNRNYFYICFGLYTYIFTKIHSNKSHDSETLFYKLYFIGHLFMNIYLSNNRSLYIYVKSCICLLRIISKGIHSRDWKDGSIDKILTTQACGLKFGYLASRKKLGMVVYIYNHGVGG